MYLKHLSLTNFRSFARLDMDIPRHTLLLVGDNAQGKTSILEAIYFLATFTSLQASHDRQLINFLLEDEPIKEGRLVADLQRGEQSHRLEVRLILDANAVNGARLRKEILVDGVKRSLQEALGIFNAVIFLPQMTRIIEGGPEERRKYLNLGLSQVYPGYARALTEYAQLITRRNALLKQLGERGGDPDQLIYWDNLLTQRGALIVKARLTALAGLNHLASAVHDRLSSGMEVLQLLYKPSVQPLAEENAQASFLSADFTEDSDEDSIRRAFAQQGLQALLGFGPIAQIVQHLCGALRQQPILQRICGFGGDVEPVQHLCQDGQRSEVGSERVHVSAVGDTCSLCKPPSKALMPIRRNHR